MSGQTKNPKADGTAIRPSILRLALTAGALVDIEPAGLNGSVIVWDEPDGEPENLIKVLGASAKLGVWNHLKLRPSSGLSEKLGEFAVENPNLVHSCVLVSRSEPFREEPHFLNKYDKIERLPGVPFWTRIPHEDKLLDHLANRSPAELRRLRVMEDGSTWLLGEEITYDFRPAAELSRETIEQVFRMVEAGGAVGTTKWLRDKLSKAFLIGLAREGGVIIGDSTLKQARHEYIENVSRSAGIDLSDYLERGYTSVRAEYRGLGVGTKLLEGLTARVGPNRIFSVIAEDDVGSQTMAIRNDTRKVATFHSDALGKEISVWMPSSMLAHGEQG